MIHGRDSMQMQAFHRRIRASLLLTLGVGAAILAGCAQLGIESKKIDYRSSTRAPSLEIPPDLSSPVYDERYKAITASGQQAGQPGAPGVEGGSNAGRLLPVTANARI